MDKSKVTAVITVEGLEVRSFIFFILQRHTSSSSAEAKAEQAHLQGGCMLSVSATSSSFVASDPSGSGYLPKTETLEYFAD